MTVIMCDMLKATFVSVLSLIGITACVGLTGCASTVTGTGADGNPVTMKVGFGNRITTPGYTVEPAETVVNSAERVSMHAINTAPDAILKVAQSRQE